MERHKSDICAINFICKMFLAWFSIKIFKKFVAKTLQDCMKMHGFDPMHKKLHNIFQTISDLNRR
nr:MAG TPA: hypothetical protein [Caudoviricetes sp.]